MRGWVYVMTNKAMHGLVKIGASGKDPKQRAKELRGTHSPHEFVVEYDVLVLNPFAIERAAHEKLSQFSEAGDGQGSEFFRCSVEEAVFAIRSLTQDHLFEVFHQENREMILAAEREALLRVEAERKQRERQIEEQQMQEAALRTAEQERLEQVAREAEEQELAANRLQETINRRTAWLAEQEQRIKQAFPNALTVANSLRLLTEGMFVMCPHCNRPHLSPYPLGLVATCDGCRNRIEIPCGN